MSLHDLSDPEKRVVGLKQVLRCARQGMLTKVYIAKDADEDVTDKIVQSCGKSGIILDSSLTMHQIGSACGIEIGSACAGILKK